MDHKAEEVWNKLRDNNYSTFQDGMKTSFQLKRPKIMVSLTRDDGDGGHFLLNGR